MSDSTDHSRQQRAGLRAEITVLARRLSRFPAFHPGREELEATIADREARLAWLERRMAPPQAARPSMRLRKEIPGAPQPAARTAPPAAPAPEIVHRIPVRAAPLETVPPPETGASRPQPVHAARRVAGAAGLAVAHGAKRAASSATRTAGTIWTVSFAFMTSCRRAAGRGVRQAGASIARGGGAIGRGVAASGSLVTDNAKRAASFAARTAGTIRTVSLAFTASCWRAAGRGAVASGSLVADNAKRAGSRAAQLAGAAWSGSLAAAGSCREVSARVARKAGAVIDRSLRATARGCAAAALAAVRFAARTGSFTIRFAAAAGKASAHGLKRGVRSSGAMMLGVGVILAGHVGPAARAGWSGSLGAARSCGEVSVRVARRAGAVFDRSRRATARGCTAAALAGVRFAARAGAFTIRFAKAAGKASAHGLKRGVRSSGAIALGAGVILAGHVGPAARAVGPAAGRALAASLATSRKVAVFAGRAATGIGRRFLAQQGKETGAEPSGHLLANAHRPAGRD